MRILLVSPLCPLPLEKGGAVRIWNIAQQLSAEHQLDLLCFIRDESELSNEADLKKVFRNVHFVLRREITSPRVLLEKGFKKLTFFQKNFPLLRDTLLSLRPLLSVLYDHPSLQRYIKIADAEREYDLIYIETFYAGAAILGDICSLRTPLFLCEQNVEYAAYQRQAETQSNIFVKLLMQFDIWKMRREEMLFWKRVPILGGLSPVDNEQIGEESEREDIVLLENGVSVPWFSEPVSERKTDEVLFVGSFSYFPNVDAIRWLIDEIWPSLETKCTLRIVGRGADESLKVYVQEKGFSIDESVDDIREAFQRASLLIAPLRAGSGTKYKVLEAMASHCPVVTTSVGAEGLDVQGGHEMIIADESTELRNAILHVLQDKAEATSLAEAGYAFVKSRYDWPEVVGDFVQKLKLH